eukprot:CAMPEP_0170539840 /NCGR_PEP_ID=MMETSP0209-20121228/104249_1 /TAXON_ID=665100 ORGANISM="Litonotus pictus, Strain P1" /NCGR_SAMPLE_ID=MMETSP0209 /ASSEMBLY_ACC=CAM_ASM_000301 /LENGTH=178 /DNA_ID=CAMNT_0010842001 /DNA_START=191 /DNA_END=723 /DNA_ORIENTATION=-
MSSSKKLTDSNSKGTNDRYSAYEEQIIKDTVREPDLTNSFSQNKFLLEYGKTTMKESFVPIPSNIPVKGEVSEIFKDKERRRRRIKDQTEYSETINSVNPTTDKTLVRKEKGHVKALEENEKKALLQEYKDLSNVSTVNGSESRRNNGKILLPALRYEYDNDAFNEGTTKFCNLPNNT